MNDTFARVLVGVVALLAALAGLYLLTHPRFGEQFFDTEETRHRWPARMGTLAAGIGALVGAGALIGAVFST